MAWLRVVWRCLTDSSAAKGMALRQGVERVRHLDMRLLRTQQVVIPLGLKIHKIPGKDNRVDLGTKRLSIKEFLRMRDLNNIMALEDVGPAAAAGVAAANDDSPWRERLEALLREMA